MSYTGYLQEQLQGNFEFDLRNSFNLSNEEAFWLQKVNV
jgi:hypothetical protein